MINFSLKFFAKLCGNELSVTEYQNAGHVIIENVFNEPKLFEWLAKQDLK